MVFLLMVYVLLPPQFHNRNVTSETAAGLVFSESHNFTGNCLVTKNIYGILCGDTTDVAIKTVPYRMFIGSYPLILLPLLYQIPKSNTGTGLLL